MQTEKLSASEKTAPTGEFGASVPLDSRQVKSSEKTGSFSARREKPLVQSCQRSYILVDVARYSDVTNRVPSRPTQNNENRWQLIVQTNARQRRNRA